MLKIVKNLTKQTNKKNPIFERSDHFTFFMEKLTEDGKVIKEIIAPGSGKFPEDGEKVEVDVVAIIKESGKEIENTYKSGKTFKFIVGKADVAEWNIGIKTMKVGEHSKFEFDTTGNDSWKSSEIPENAVLVYDIILLRACKVYGTADESVQAANKINDEAAVKFKEGDNDAALDLYLCALNTIEDYTDESVNEVKARTMRNLSLVYNKKEDWKKSLEFANNVLDIVKDDLKALMRKIEALIYMGSIEEGKKVYAHALVVSKNNPAFVTLRSKIEEVERKERQRENKEFAKMFGK